MSDKSLRFLLFGEDKTASATFGKAADNATSATGRIGGVFTKMGTMVGGEVGALVDRVGAGFTQMGEHGAKMGAKLMGIGGSIAGLGVFAQSFASKDQAAHQQLTAAVDATGKSYEGFKEDVEKAISTQEKYGHKATDTQEALRKMTQAFQDPKKALESMTLVENLAAAKHISLSEAAQLVARVHGGAGRVLKEFGLTLTSSKTLVAAATTATKAHETAVTAYAVAQKKLTDLEAVDAGKKKLSVSAQIALRNAHDAVAVAQGKVKTTTEAMNVAQAHAKDAAGSTDKALGELGKRLTGQAAAASDTFAGKLAGVRAHVEDVGASVAGKMGPALTVAGPIIFGVGAILETGLIPALGRAGLGMLQMAGRAVVWGATMLAAGATAMLPFLPIILIVAAVGVAAYLLWKNWDTVWKFIKGAVSDGWNWIKTHFDLIIQVGLGPLGIAIVFFKNHWSQIWEGIQSTLGAAWGFISGVFGWIRTNAIAPLVGEISALGSAWSSIWGGITSTIAGAWNYISGIISRITGAIGGVASTIGSALKSIPGLGALGSALHIPGFAGGVTDFSGGLALVGETGSELVHLPAHSTVVPHSQTMAMLSGGGSGRSGPLLHIENYNEANHPPQMVAADLAFRMRTA